MKRSRVDVTRFILTTIGAVGLLSLALIAPNALRALDLFRENKRSRYYLQNRLRQLAALGLITFVGKEGKSYVRLTEKGEKRLRQYRLGELVIKRPWRWDGQWRFLIFDIRETRKKVRDRLRRLLVQLGFVRVQDSVWVYPYDCFEVVALLKAEFKLGKSLLYLVVAKLENDRWLREHFKL